MAPRKKHVPTVKEQLVSEALSDFAKEVTGDSGVFVQWRDLGDNQGVKAMVRKRKIVIGRTDSVNDAVGMLVNVLPVRQALYSLDEPLYFSDKGFDVLDQEKSREIREKYNEIAKSVRKRITSSPAYNQWQYAVCGIEAKMDEDGTVIETWKTKKPTSEEIQASATRWGKHIEEITEQEWEKTIAKEIDVAVSSKRGDAKKAMKLHRLPNDMYVSTVIPLEDLQKNRIKIYQDDLSLYVNEISELRDLVSGICSEKDVEPSSGIKKVEFSSNTREMTEFESFWEIVASHQGFAEDMGVSNDAIEKFIDAAAEVASMPLAENRHQEFLNNMVDAFQTDDVTTIENFCKSDGLNQKNNKPYVPDYMI